MNGIDESLLVYLPLRVQGVSFQDPILHLFGEKWSLTLACPWQGQVLGEVATSEDKAQENWALKFIGRDLVSVKAVGVGVKFEFQAGFVTVFPDYSDQDPWVLSTPDGFMVGVRSDY